MDLAMHLLSPFVAFDRWKEAIGSPPPPRWIRFSSVPLQAWNGCLSSIGGLHRIYSLSRSLHVGEEHPNPRPVWRNWQVGFESSRFRSPFMLVIFWSLSRSKKIRSICCFAEVAALLQRWPKSDQIDRCCCQWRPLFKFWIPSYNILEAF